MPARGKEWTCPRCQARLNPLGQVVWHRPFACAYCNRLIKLRSQGTLELGILALIVGASVFFILRVLQLPRWGALIGVAFAWFPITNQLSLIITSARKRLEPFFQTFTPDPRLPFLLEEIASASSWTENHQKQLDEIVVLAEGELASLAIHPAQRLLTMLQEGEPKQTLTSYAFGLILLWKIARSAETIPTTRKELLAIAADLRKVELRESP